jgi:uncharacterized protein (TIGR00730 family)
VTGVDALAAVRRPLTRVCVFCGSNAGTMPEYARAAEALADALVSRHIDLVFGGGRVGLMGIVADAMLARGGHVIGVIPHALVTREVAHLGLPDLRVVASMHERKAMMADLADAFIALPGGFGTFEEFCEVVTWTQLGLHRKGCGLLNVRGFFDPLLAMFDRAVADGFLPVQNRAIVSASADPGALLDILEAAVPVAEPKWLRTPAES